MGIGTYLQLSFVIPTAATKYTTASDMHRLHRVSLDLTVGVFTAISAGVVMGEAYARTSLGDAQTAKECRYPPLSQIITAEHVRELEKNDLVVIRNVLSKYELESTRRDVQRLSRTMDVSNHSNDNDVRQDQICLVREDDKQEHGDEMIHCIKLLRGIPYMLDRFEYSSSSSFVTPRQCQLSMYLPDGSTYARHLDQCNIGILEMGLLEWLRASDYRHRVVTAILYLNSADWNGEGQLRYFDKENNSFDVDPIGGTLVLFNSSKVEHEVQPSTKDRYALTLWINGVQS